MLFELVLSLVGFLFIPVVCLSSAQTPLLQHAASNHTISATLFAELEELARLVDIAYCVGTGTGLGIRKPFQCLSRCKDFENFELVTTWNTGPFMSDSCGYMALSHPPNDPRLIIAFRGTYSLANTIADLSSMPQEYVPYPGDDEDEDETQPREPEVPKCTGCTVHTGFYTSWRHTRREILPHITQAMQQYPSYKPTLIGHSLGGAVAAFAALELLDRGLSARNLSITTFGEPRIGNAALADYLDARFNLSRASIEPDPDSNPYRRVTHIDDPVPQLPLAEWGYAPHAGEIFIAKPALPPSLADIRHCAGNADPSCIEQPAEERARGDEGDPAAPSPAGWWELPGSRLRLWQLFFAHRDYFARLGVCLPGGDPFSRWDDTADEL